jgi:hypothetical protein
MPMQQPNRSAVTHEAGVPNYQGASIDLSAAFGTLIRVNALQPRVVY